MATCVLVGIHIFFETLNLKKIKLVDIKFERHVYFIKTVTEPCFAADIYP